MSFAWFALRVNITLCLSVAAGLAQAVDPGETIRIDTNLVDLKVRVANVNGERTVLEQKDFEVFENGEIQEIVYFAASESPFDLLLLIDLSGSTVEKLKIIRRSAKQFVEAARLSDRVSIVTFSDRINVVSDFTLDRTLLKRLIDRIEKPSGGTSFWDSLNYVLEKVAAESESSRRSAVVVMTDGVDNALPDVYGEGSQVSFPTLLQSLRESPAMVFPIYLDTEKELVKRDRRLAKAYVTAREQLAALAGASGTVVYRANKLKDLEKVYHQVISDIATVYSISYTPADPGRDGQWRSVDVQVRDHPGVIVHTKPGYYARVRSGP